MRMCDVVQWRCDSTRCAGEVARLGGRLAAPWLSTFSNHQRHPPIPGVRLAEVRGCGVNVWAYLLTVKLDTVKTSNRILDTLWEALSG